MRRFRRMKSMGFLKRIIKEPEAPGAEPTEMFYKPIDLGTYVSRGAPPGRIRGGMNIRVAEIERYEDARDLTTCVYDGDILILDFTPIANDDLTLRRIIAELKRLTEDINGDLAGLNRNMIIVTPRSVRIDKRKLRRTVR
jgi:hypothetical protein